MIFYDFFLDKLLVR